MLSFTIFLLYTVHVFDILYLLYLDIDSIFIHFTTGGKLPSSMVFGGDHYRDIIILYVCDDILLHLLLYIVVVVMEVCIVCMCM